MSKQPNEDLFEGTTMTFGEHLDELRVVLFRSIIGLLVCVILGFFVAREVVKKIQGPLRKGAANALPEEGQEGHSSQVWR